MSSTCIVGLVGVSSHTSYSPTTLGQTRLGASCSTNIDDSRACKERDAYLGLLADGALEVGGHAHVDELEREVRVRRADAMEEAVRAAVHVGVRNDLIARLEQMQHRRRGSEARRERNTELAVLERRDVGLEGVASRVTGASILVALQTSESEREIDISTAAPASYRVHARRLLIEGAGETDGSHDSARDRIGLLAGMDRQRAEALEVRDGHDCKTRVWL